MILNERGQSMVELALVIVIFLAVILVLGDMVRICYNWVSLQYAVNEAARLGSVDQDSSAVSAKITTITDTFGVRNVTVSFLNDQGSATPGAALSFFTLTARTPVVLNPVSGVILSITGDYSGTYNVAAQTVIRNEPSA